MPTRLPGSPNESLFPSPSPHRSVSRSADRECRWSGMPAVVNTLLRLFSDHEETAAAATLGPRHPLVRALQSRRARARQLLVTALALALGLVGTVDHTG